MPELTPDIAADVVAAAQAGAEEAAGALSRALDGEFTLSVGESATFDPAAAPAGFAGPGLAMLFKIGDTAAVAVLTEESGLTPDWAPSPDPTGESKLATLAQELSMLLLPETLMADDFQSAWVGDISGALARGGLSESAAVVPLEITAGENLGTLWLLWPLATPGEFSQEQTPAPNAAAPAAPSAEPPPTQPEPNESEACGILDLSQLPAYSRSLLKVEVPVLVTLAEKKQPLQEVMTLGPGSILAFDKPCDDPIDISIGDHKIASGETMKVGEKFGVKIRQIHLPDERFQTVKH